MEIVQVNLKETSYPIYICEDYEKIAGCLRCQGLDGIVAVITDTNVYRSQFKNFAAALKKDTDHDYHYVIEAGEKSKNLDTVREIYSYLKEYNFDRSITLVALGGGVVGDITGFTASTYLRGVNFVQVPTSLLAQVDSSVGGKVGVNFCGVKNLIGSFYQPQFVYININSLLTLPEREFRSGLAEVIVHGIAVNGDLFDFVEENIDSILRYDKKIIKELIRVNCMAKSKVVEQDEKDKGIRAILNFGHTIGHAIEMSCGLRLLHGECVSIGVAGAFKLAYRLGLVNKETLNRVERVLKSAGLPVRISGLNVDTVLAKMASDKKAKGRKIVFVLPKRIGEVVIYPVDDISLIREVICELLGYRQD